MPVSPPNKFNQARDNILINTRRNRSSDKVFAGDDIAAGAGGLSDYLGITNSSIIEI
ncbi:MAG: hypothetical protein M1818_000979 [Claussenomyces sp. TS43310]|nr:MAG: hypothetical protein M1818_000979 [Claussenomyces sp. TS43310]